MLISATETYPSPVSNISIKRLKERISDLCVINRVSFLSSLLEGNIDDEEIEL